MQKKIRIELGTDHTLLMKLVLFDEDEEIDLDRLVRVDVANLAMEIITIPIILNKLGFLLADANHNINTAKLEYEILEAKLAEEVRNAPLEKGEKPPSNDKVNETITRNPKYILKKQIYFKRLKEQEQISSLYWAAKSKNDKIDKLSMSIQSEDVQEAVINNKLKRFNYIDTTILKTNNK